MRIVAATKMSRRDNFIWAGHGATPSAYVYILRLLHRLGHRIGNHRQLPSVPIQWVTDMPTCNVSRHALYDSRGVIDRR